jgi:N-acetylglucosamine kinase-like BadF-type ATPase
MHYFLGIDTGGTKTHALIADESGRLVGFGEAGPGNHESVGYEGVVLALTQATNQALQSAGIERDQIAGAGFGIAGYDWPSERQPTLDAIAHLGLQCPLDVVNDAILGLIAGAEDGWGVVIDAGTGNNAKGRDRQGREGHSTGCGGYFGEYGGAGDVVWQAVVAINYEWTRRGPATALTPAFIKLLGAADIADLLEGLALEKYHLDASAARLVFQVAAEGDLPAQKGIAWIGRQHGEAAVGIIRQLDFQKENFDIVLIGSLFLGGPMLLDPMKEVILAEAPGARFVRLEAPPATGGVLLGMEQAGFDTHTVRPVLIRSAREHIAQL